MLAIDIHHRSLIAKSRLAFLLEMAVLLAVAASLGNRFLWWIFSTIELSLPIHVDHGTFIYIDIRQIDLGQ